MKPDIKDSVSGIYCIRNIETGKVYIGKSKNIYKRIHQHIYDLKNNRKNENMYFQNSWNKYGKDSFTYTVLEKIDLKDEDLFYVRELYWMDFFNSTNNKFGFNLRRDSSTKMITHPSTSKKISERLKKEWKSGIRDGHSKKLSDNWKNNNERKINQSNLFSKIKTKYEYYIYNLDMVLLEVCNYKKLSELGLKGSLSSFSKNKKDLVKCKNNFVKRVKIEDIVQSS